MTSLVVDPTTDYVRDDNAYATIDENEFGGTFSDPDVAITYTGDGRLQGINASTVGEGPSIVKGVVSVFAAVAVTATVAPPPADSLCARIEKVTKAAAAAAAPAKKVKAPGDKNSDAAVSIIYTADFEYYLNGTNMLLRDDPNAPEGTGSSSLTIKPSPESTSIYDHLKLDSEEHHAITVTVEKTQLDPQPRATLYTNDKISNDHSQNKTIKTSPVPNFNVLTINKATGIRLVVKGPNGGMTETRDLWRGDVSVPIPDYDYILVPKGGAFGTHSFSATFAADGQLSVIQYKSSGTASQTMDALNDALGALPKKKEQETAGKRADDIHDSNRLRLCLADPTNCPAN
ncbi:hypothetical protein [Pinirhizobacter soli]|uniref:hypothetical protein n=1 Tax=Pinirhizobacter soli TaxID=2786953 RepID=UPI00202AB63D|nr:hypothetical protein [Pinirhizobacter soli]